MAQPSLPHVLPTVEEYLQMEETATVRHEYVGGMIYAMVGASKRYNQIGLNIASRLLSASRAVVLDASTQAT